MKLKLSSRANGLVEKYNERPISSHDIHFEDVKFLDAQYFLNISNGKITDISYKNGANLELDSLVLATLEMAKNIGVHYLLMANFREIENYLRDDLSVPAWPSIGAQKENWESSLFVLIRSTVYCLLLKSGLEFVSIPKAYTQKIDLLDGQFENINQALRSYGLMTFEIISLEENELYIKLVSPNKIPDQIALSLCDGVCEYLTLCYGQSYIKLVATKD